MTNLTQPNRWSCGSTSLAMVLGLSHEEVIQGLGHDGSQLLPEPLDRLPEPLCRTGFHIPEFVDLALKHGVTLIEIPSSYEQIILHRGLEYVWEPGIDHQARLSHYMKRYSGLVVIQPSAKNLHMVAWDHISQMIFDPDRGSIRPLEDVAEIITFWAASVI